MKKIKIVTKIILIFAFSTGALACGFAYYTHANPISYFHLKRQPDPPKNKKLDLQIDSTCHYFQDGLDVGCRDARGRIFGTWPVKDLTSEKFFNFPDLKPGDSGEDTMSLHVSGDDACGRIEIENLKSFGNTCTEPETTSTDPFCNGKNPGTSEPQGQMAQNLQYSIWLDQGDIPGFQGTKADPHEGDNIFNGKDYVIFDWQSFSQCPKAIALKSQLEKVRDLNKLACDAKTADADGDGDSKNKVCQGIPRDGHLMKDVIYYVGLSWRLPASVGNEVQTDGISFDVKFLATSKENCSSHDFTCGQCRDGCDECDNKKCGGH